MAAKTVFVMLYVGAIDSREEWIRPDQITRMTDAQASKKSDPERLAWVSTSTAPRKRPPAHLAWYAANTREPIRDETIRQGFVEYGVIVERPLPTTSSKGRYALKDSFAKLFDPALRGKVLKDAISEWRADNLSPGALMRVRLMHQAVAGAETGMVVRFPNGETRRLVEGPSSMIAKAVIEQYATRFLDKPGVLWLSESAQKEVHRDARLAVSLNLKIDIGRTLPDIILVDLGPKDPQFVFVEAVATDGAVTETRKEAFTKLVTEAGYSEAQAAFVTAYFDREHAAFKKTFPSIAWGSSAWCVSEPEGIIVLRRPAPRH